LQWVAPENRQEVLQILEQAERAASSWDLSYSKFVNPAVAADALKAIGPMADISAIAWGGYPQAERCRLVMGREELMLPYKDDPAQLEGAAAALDVRGNFMFDPASHRDFLGAILGTGTNCGSHH
jgi:RNA-binding protein YlmH